MQREGKVRWVGLSNVSVAEIEEARAIVKVVSVQNRLNPFFREAIETGVIAHCEANGIGFLAYSPLGGGRLNKKLPGHPSLTPMARRNRISPHAAVLAWCLSKGKNVIVIPGARTVEHALDSLTAADLKLSIQELAVIDGADSVMGWCRAAFLGLPGPVLAAGLAVGLLSFHEIEAAIMLQPPGWDSFPRQIATGGWFPSGTSSAACRSAGGRFRTPVCSDMEGPVSS